MSTRNKVMYSGSSMPTGTRTLDVYRPTNPLLVSTPSVNSTKIITAAVCEDWNIDEDGNTIRRRGTQGEPTDMKLQAGLKTATGTFQMATGTTPTIQRGDFVCDSFEIDAAGAATATEQYVVTKASAPEKTDDARKQTLSFEIDFTNSVRWA